MAHAGNVVFSSDDEENEVIGKDEDRSVDAFTKYMVTKVNKTTGSFVSPNNSQRQSTFDKTGFAQHQSKTPLVQK